MEGAQAERKVTVAGGGIAALEAVLALRSLAEDVAIELLAPRLATDYRPLSVLVPYALGEMPELDLAKFAADQRVSLRQDTLVEVRAPERVLHTGRGETLSYGLLLVAAGAEALDSVPGAIPFRGPEDTRQLGLLFEEYAGGELRSLLFAVPSERGWALPAYELALLAAATLSARAVSGVKLGVVTPEPVPLAAFGGKASEAVAELLALAGIELHTGTTPRRLEHGVLATDGGALAADRVVALPRLVGPRLRGLPHDEEGFIPTDPHGRVEGLEDVYAAGDATSYPIKQGGLAAQQADAAAEAMAARLGVAVDPAPFRPVLRGLLLTGLTPTYLEADLTSPEEGPPPRPALWKPSSKVFGRHLLDYLGAESVVERPAPGEQRGGVPVDLELDASRRG